MGAAVDLNHAAWSAAFPLLSAATEPQVQEAWNLAGLIWPNDGSGPATSEAEQRTLMNLLTAHLVQLGQMASTGGSLVGRITSASEGSVSVSVEGFGQLGFSRSWLVQTSYGATFLAATMKYRGARWIGAPRRSFEPRGTPWAP